MNCFSAHPFATLLLRSRACFRQVSPFVLRFWPGAKTRRPLSFMGGRVGVAGVVVLAALSAGGGRVALGQAATATAQTLPGSAVGTAAVTAQVTFTITTAGTLGTSIVLTQGAPNLDFTLNSAVPGTCSGTVVAGTCHANVIFNPTKPGLRMGAVELKNASGTVIATALIQATGTGPLVSFSPGTISTVAGNGAAGYVASQDGGPATSAKLAYPEGVAVDGAGNLYIADQYNNRIRKVTAATGIITTVAGNGTQGYVSAQDGGPATSAELYNPDGVAVDGAGNLYLADLYNQRIRKVTAATGIITTVAGNGNQGYVASQDGGPATSAELSDPAGVAVDGAGNLYIADQSNQRIRKVTAATGIITTVAGNGTAGYVAAQDGGPATSAELQYPAGVAVDGAGNLYIADLDNQRIRKVTAATGIITTVAGNGNQGYAASQDGGPATSAELQYPAGVAVDGAGNLYIADQENERIRKVTAATGIITTVAGNGTQGYVASQDGGPATSAELQYPAGVAVDGAGNLYIPDSYNQRIRKVTATAANLLFADTAVGSSSATQTVTVNNIGNASLTLPIPASGFNPSLAGSNYTLSNSSTCPQPSASSGADGTIAAGSDCTEILSYTPTAAGASSGYLQFTDNSLNAAAATQLFSFSGTTTNSTTLTITATSASIVAGTPSVTLTFITGYGSNKAPTATPTLTVNGSATGVGNITCISKAGHMNCSAAYNSASLAAGGYTILATQPADSNYTTATSAMATLTVTPAPSQGVKRKEKLPEAVVSGVGSLR